MTSSRNRRIAAYVAGGVAVALIVAASIAWIRAGEIVARRTERIAREHYGLDVVVRSASVTMSGISLEGVEISLPHVDGFVLRFESIDVSGSPLRMAARRLAAVREVTVHGGVARVELTEATLSALAAYRRERLHPSGAPPSAPSTTGTRLPPVHADGIGLDLVDAIGTLVHVEGGRLETDSGPLRADAELLELGDEASDHVRFRSVTGVLRRDDGVQLESIDAEAIDARWVLSIDSLDRAAEAHLVRRVRAAIDLAKRSFGTSETVAHDASRSRLDRWTTRDFAATAGEASVRAGSGDAEKRLLLHGISLRRLDATRIAIVGEGEGESGVSARWNLELEPTALRAVGTVRVSRLPLALVGPLVPEIPWEPSIPGMVSVDVELEARGLDAVELRGAVDFEGVALSHPRLAAEPLRDLALRIEGEGTLRPLERRFVLRTARFTTGSVPIEWNGTVEVGPGTRVIRGRFSLPSTECERAVHAIPADVLGPLTGFHLGGTIAGRVDVDLDTRQLDRTVLDVTVDDECVFEAFPPEVDLARFEAPFQHVVVEPDDTTFEMETGPGTPNWVSFGAISPYMVEAVLAHEDGAFFRHRGFAPWAIRDAVVRNLREGRYVVGASTITMQLAKNLFLHREKTLIRKVQEVILTWWLERSLEKERLLELYLNVIEYGPSIYGLRAASNFYFSCSPSQLTPVEAAFLATVLPAPKLYGIPASGAFSPAMQLRLERFLRHMAATSRLSQEDLEAALAQLGTFRFRGGGNAAYFVPDDAPVGDGSNPLDFMPDAFPAE